MSKGQQAMAVAMVYPEPERQPCKVSKTKLLLETPIQIRSATRQHRRHGGVSGGGKGRGQGL
jgi:hypothetical protein